MLTPQRPHKRDDGLPTRSDALHWTSPESAIARAMAEVERAGASPALTDAISLLWKAKERVADHVEALPCAMESWMPSRSEQKAAASNVHVLDERFPPPPATQKVSYTQEQLDAAVEQAVDRDRISNFLLFARNLPEGPASLVYGTNLSARAIMRALEKAGFK